MGFRELSIEDYYFSTHVAITREFYIPLLGEAVTYQRAVGFFSSTALYEISDGLFSMAGRNGKIQLIASPRLSKEDVEAIHQGIIMRQELIIKRISEAILPPETKEQQDRLNFLVHLIATGILDIRIALMQQEGIGIYHEKLGFFYDEQGNVVSFSGSMNESETAMVKNGEAIDVFCSWKGEADRRRIRRKQEHFEHMWKNEEQGMWVMEFPEAAQKKLFQYRTTEPILQELSTTYGIYQEEKPEKARNVPRITKEVSIREYQSQAIRRWEECNFQGIFDMATGTGKTYTGIAAICHLYEKLQGRLAVVIVCPFQHLVEQWVEDLEVFGITPVIAYGIAKYKNYPQKLRRAVFSYNLKKENFFCLITTIDTFAGEKVQRHLREVKDHLLLVADEAHNLGARTYQSLLTDRYQYRLALSATFDRYQDEEGTQLLYDFFGRKCIEYTLEQAIAQGMLTRYYYYPVLVYLTEEELKQYEQISVEITKNVKTDKKGKLTLNEKGKQLAIKRARICAGAVNKLSLLEELMADYKEENHMLIYCGATRVIEEELTEEGAEDIRQIDAITRILGLKLHMKVAQFTSRENAKERKLLKEEFAKGEELQALVAIKCLDEGVNIPAIGKAFILASTTNPKEYIQRRGRVLRLAEGKDFAYIYDFVTLPRELEQVAYYSEEQLKYEKVLVKNELKRIEEFRRLSENSYDSLKLLHRIRDAYGLYEEEEEEET